MINKNNNRVTRNTLSCLRLIPLKGWIQFLSDISKGMLLPIQKKRSSFGIINE